MSTSCNESTCGTLPECEGCSKGTKTENKQKEEKKLPENHIKRVIGVVSGKGGVGKSMTTAMLGVMLSRLGYNVGILDGDLTGPSIPKMLGIKGRVLGNDVGILPKVTANGIKVMSINLLLDTEETPVIWRGPVLAGVITQFWEQVVWEELDFLLIDMPPGTGDVPLTVFQSIPLDGIVIVTTPQDLVGMIVKKAYNMAKQMNINIIGLVENMSYVQCPDCNKKIYCFGQSNVTDIADSLGIDSLGSIPLSPELSALADNSELEKAISSEYKEIADAIDKYFK